jgi:choline dehydrogenase-like flavoprotein
MIIDLNNGGPATLSADVAVVGAGAAGITTALKLLQSGIQTVLIEAGSERVRKVSQGFYEAASIHPETHDEAHLARMRVLGGTTAIWGGRCIPFDPIDFERRPWLPHSGWPISYADVAQYIAEATAQCEAGNAEFETGEPFLTPLDDASGTDLILNRVARYSPPTRFGKKYRKALAASTHVKVLINASVTEVLTNANGAAVSGVSVRTPAGTRMVVHANRVVLALGGLETPRLLLASNRINPRGLGNDRDLVGRFYQTHLEGVAGTLQLIAEADAEQLKPQLARDGVFTTRYIWLSPDAQRREQLGGFVIRPARIDVVDPANRLPWASASFLTRAALRPAYKAPFNAMERRSLHRWKKNRSVLFGKHLANVAYGLPTIMANTARKASHLLTGARRRPRWDVGNPLSWVMEFHAEQVPNPSSRVFLAREVDALGMPRLAIHWSPTAQDHEIITRSLSLMCQALETTRRAKLDLNRLTELTHDFRPSEGHHIGTTRMAATAAEGVVDRNCQVFGVHGLYVAGASVFATSGFANPTLMVVALARRLGDHLAAAASQAQSPTLRRASPGDAGATAQSTNSLPEL